MPKKKEKKTKLKKQKISNTAVLILLFIFVTEYEQGGGEAIQWNPNFGKERKEPRSNSFYHRTMASIRNLLSCCIGKT